MTQRVQENGRSIDFDGQGEWSKPAPAGLEVARRVRSIHARVALAIKDLPFHQEVLDFLERDPRVSVVGSVTQPDALFRLLNATKPEVTVVCPLMARDARHPSAGGRMPNLFLVAEEMTVPVLREAIDAGAKAVFAWPEEREDLVRTIAAVPRDRDDVNSGRGRVIAVFGPRGGTGTTFLACQLAAVLADYGRKCVLVDLDASFADVTVALGVEVKGDVRTIADLVPVADELAPEHVEDALYRHPRGFSVLLAGSDPSRNSPAVPELHAAAIEQLTHSYEVAVLHVPRSLDEEARVGLSLADDVILVVAPDVFSLHAARRAVDALGLDDPAGRCRIVINQAARGAVGASEVEQAIAIRPSAEIRFDPAVGRLQDRGELLPARARGAARDVRALVRQLVGSPAQTREGARSSHGS